MADPNCNTVGDRLDFRDLIELPRVSVWLLRRAEKNDGAEAWSKGSVSVAVVALVLPPLFQREGSTVFVGGFLISFPPQGGASTSKLY